MEDKKNLIFVYGTLRKGYHGQHSAILAEKGEWVGLGKVNGVQIYLNDHLPMLIESENKETFLVGDVYKITDSLVTYLDKYEGIDKNWIYSKITVDVKVGEDKYSCMTYAITKPDLIKLIKHDCHLMTCSDYLEYMEKTHNE